jgi:sugar-specific transcriptional regulator TrmB
MPDIMSTSYALWAVSRVNGVKDPSAQKALQWLVNRQKENGSWEDRAGYTAEALIGLLAMGEGPKVPLESVNYQLQRIMQTTKKQKPVFVHTSPQFYGSFQVKEIYDKVKEMLHSVEREIRIISPYIDMFYGEIINIAKEKPNLVIKIITRPKGEIEGERKRIAKSAINKFYDALKERIVHSQLIHSRMLIVDDKQLLVSSADLTTDQLYDEFNAGIWTSDKEAVEKATAFFENIFQLEQSRKAEKNPKT